MSEEDEARAKLVANERAKLTATYLNGLAIALVAVGGFAPAFSARPGVTTTAADPVALALTLAFCIATSGILHFVARIVLRGLR